MCVCARIFNLNSEVRHLVVQNSKLPFGGSKTFTKTTKAAKLKLAYESISQSLDLLLVNFRQRNLTNCQNSESQKHIVSKINFNKNLFC